MATNRKEVVAEKIQRMDRNRLVRMLRGMQCDFEMDFTDEYLQSVSLDRLKHIILAASLHAHK